MNATCRMFLLLAALPALAPAAETVARELTVAERLTPDAQNGAELYRQCVSCHGGDGNGQANGSVPRIAGQHESVVLKQLIDFRHAKRWDFRMESMSDRHHLPEVQDVVDVTAYVSSLESAGQRGIGDGTNAEVGARLYAARCASCHGADAAGDARTRVPRLAGQHYEYLARQMYDAIDGRRPSLARAHGRRIEPLDFEQIRAIADHLSRADLAATR